MFERRTIRVPAEKDSSVVDQTFTEDERMLYIEPSLELHKKFSMGMSGHVEF